MGPRRAALTQPLHELLHHAPAMTAALNMRQQIDVEMGRIGFVGLRKEVIRMMVTVMSLLNAGPGFWVAGWFRETGAQVWPPLFFIAFKECSRIESGKSVAADAALILQQQAEIRFKSQIRPHVDAAQRIGILPIKRLAILAAITRLQTDVICARFIT